MLFALAVCPAAQAEERVRLSDRAVVAMGTDSFFEYYVTKTWDMSEAGYDDAARFYAEARRRLNDRDARALTRAERLKVNALRESLANLDYQWLMCEMSQALGGTMYGHMATRDVAGREDFIAEVIAAWRKKPGSDSAAHAAVNRDMDELRRRIMARPEPDYADFQDYVDTDQLESWRATYLQAHAQLVKELARFERLVARLPDAIAARAAAYALGHAVSLTGEESDEQ